MFRLGIALGSNTGDRLRHLARARDALLALAGPQDDFRQAPVFSSAPVDCPPNAPDFLNTALELDVHRLALPDFLLRCQEIEASMGRPLPKHRHRNAPRPIDIDLLYLADGSHLSPGLILPHPRMTDRAFVLLPLAAIAPDRIPGGHSRSIATALAALPPASPPLRLFASIW